MYGEGDRFHWTEQGKQVQANAVADLLRGVVKSLERSDRSAGVAASGADADRG